MSSCLPRHQLAEASRPGGGGYGSVRDIPERWTPTEGHVNVSRAEGDHALFVEEELTDRSIGGWMGLEGCVSLHVHTVERRDSALHRTSDTPKAQYDRSAEEYIVVSGPEELLMRIEGERADGGRRAQHRGRREQRSGDLYGREVQSALSSFFRAAVLSG